MKISLSENDQSFLRDMNIIHDNQSDLTEDEALSLLDAIYDIETAFANSSEKSDQRYAAIYAKIADKVQEQIPE